MCQPGHGERLKATIHAALGSLAALCTLYNATAWGRRRERHLAVNVILYAALTVFESAQVRRHLRGSHEEARDGEALANKSGVSVRLAHAPDGHTC